MLDKRNDVSTYGVMHPHDVKLDDFYGDSMYEVIKAIDFYVDD